MYGYADEIITSMGISLWLYTRIRIYAQDDWDDDKADDDFSRQLRQELEKNKA